MKCPVKKPSRLARWFFLKMAKTEEKRTISGDMDEFYLEILEQQGPWKATTWYWSQVLGAIPSFLSLSIYWSTCMLTNYFKTAFRVIRKYKGYSLINITGLAIGLASCMVILLFVLNELSFDRFHEDSDNIYRVALRGNIGSNQFDIANGPPPLAAALKDEIPEVKACTRLYTIDAGHFKHNNALIKEERIFFADTTLFDVFTLTLLEGDIHTALEKPFSILLTPESAIKYFDSPENAMGKTLVTADDNTYLVTGIIQPLPFNSHFRFDFIASLSSVPRFYNSDQWIQNAVYTYIKVIDNVTIEQLEEKVKQLTDRHIAPVIEQGLGMDYQQFLESGNYFGFFLQPLHNIHLHSELGNELGTNGNYNTVIVFSAIALIILLIACVNFINLSTARSAQRSNEVGVRKVMGSDRSNLINQFLTESVILCSIAIFFATVLVALCLPLFNNVLGVELNASTLVKWYTIPLYLLSLLIIGILAGAYPAFMMSSFKPVDVLKGKAFSGKQGQRFRNVLVIFQFIISIALFAGTFVVYSQLKYMQNKDLGYDREHVVVIPNSGRLQDRQQIFKNRIKENSNVINATVTIGLPQFDLSAQIYQKEGGESNESHTLINILADYDFIDTYHIKMKEGRFFNPDFATDSAAVILNEAAVRALNFDDPLNKGLTSVGRSDYRLNVIGVYSDFHLLSLHEEIRPMISTLIRDVQGQFISVRIQAGKMQETISDIQAIWNEMVPNHPFEYEFFDSQFNDSYRTEIQSGKVFTAFACLAIFIACLGLFGLASFTAARRTKEIGIRKALGAPVYKILFMMSSEFVKWVLIANVVAWPLAWLATSKWLENFAFRIDLSVWIFILSGALAIVIALLTVSYQSVRAALANPVDSLRYE